MYKNIGWVKETIHLRKAEVPIIITTVAFFPYTSERTYRIAASFTVLLPGLQWQTLKNFVACIKNNFTLDWLFTCKVCQVVMECYPQWFMHRWHQPSILPFLNMIYLTWFNSETMTCPPPSWWHTSTYSPDHFPNSGWSL